MIIRQPKARTIPPYVFFDKEFTPAECNTIIHLAKGLRPIEATTAGGIDKGIRTSVVSWLSPTPENQWIFDKLANVAAKVQQNWYPFSLSGFEEPIQLTHYLASEGGHYDTHKDMGDGDMSTRKLSFVVLLSDPSDFKGGELELLGVPGENKAVKEIAQGAVVAFPSWELHRVLKVTEGERWSLVCWVHGPLFT